MADRSIVTRLRAEIGQYKQAMEEAARATRQVTDEQDKTTSKSKENTKSSEEAARKAKESAQQQREAWDMVGGSLLAVGTGVTALGVSMLKTGIEYNVLQQTARAGLTSLLGSAKAAGDQMDRLDDFARNSPFSKATFIQAQQQMIAFGIESRKVVPYLDAIQNAVAASGGSNDDIAGIAATMSKIQSSAKITAEDLNELGGRGVNAAELIGSQMGMTGAQIREAITSGSLDATEALDALAAGMSEKFAGAADNVKNTFAGAMDRVKAAWRDLSSALAEPFVGKEGGGLFTGLLNETADLMRSIEDLPGPVKGVIAILGGLGGAASLAAGGYILLLPRIAETKAQLDLLAKTSPTAAAGLSAVAKAAGYAAAALAVYATAKAAGAMLDDDLASTASFEKAMSGVASGTKSARAELEKLSTFKVNESFFDKLDFGGSQSWEKDIAGLSDAISTFDMGKVDKIGDKLNGLFRTSRGEAGKTIVDNIDQALTKMVAEGSADKAVEGFKYFADQAAKAGKSTAEARAMLPGYTAALEEADAQAQSTGGSTAELADTVARLTEEWQANATAAMGQRGAAIQAAEALDAAREAMEGGAQVVRDHTGAIDANAVSTRDADSALLNLAAANLKNYDAMVANGAQSAALDAALATQRQSFIDTAIQMGYTADEANALADQYGQIPRSIPTTVSLDRAPNWYEKYNSMNAEIANLAKPRTVAMTIQPLINAVAPTGLSGLLSGGAWATGGEVSGPGTATSDSIPARLSNGEHVLTAADVRAMGGQRNVYRFRESLHGHAYADGGAVDYRAAARASFATGGAVTGGGRGSTVIENHFHVTAPSGTNEYQLATLVAGETAFVARGSGQGGN